MATDKEKPRILVDVDGTLTVGPGNYPHEFAPLNTGVRQFLGALKDRGLEVVIFSARSPVESVRAFLKREGLMPFVDKVTRTKLPSRLLIDDRALTFRGSFPETLAEIDKFKPHWETAHDFSSVMALLPPSVVDKVRTIAAKVSDEDLHEDGREGEPHVTVKFGVHGDDPSGVKRAIAGSKPATIKIGPLSLFQSDKQDVLKMDVDSPELHEWNAAINRECPHTDTHPEYRPHVTVAYTKPGKGPKYLTLDNPLNGESVTLGDVVFSDRRKFRQQIVLNP